MAYSAKDMNDTIVALATPPGIGAIGVIRLSGQDAIRICNRFFFGKNLEEQDSHTIHLGTIRDEKNIILDEVLVSLFVAPKSYTKENVVEISCHGSNYILQSIIQLFLRNGARTAQRGEFTMRAFLNGQLDLSQAEAVADLIASDSEKSHELALKQMRGGFSQEIAKLRQELIDFASLIELELDFGEEDVEFANRDKLRALVEQIRGLLQRLIESFTLGNVLKNGVQTVIAGRPNAGKSTLLIALLNEERAIVSDIAGTTRDTIEESLNINGVLFRLVDTAGIREAQDTIEAIGVEKTMEKIGQSSLLVYVFDAVQTPPDEVKKDLESLYQENLHTIVVANKADLKGAIDFNDYAHQNLQENNFIILSAKQQTNIAGLKKELFAAVTDAKVSGDNTIITNTRHLEALQKSHESLSDVLKGMDMQVTSDFIAMDIRRALAFLGEITGEISTDDLLGNIFGRFCIGK